MGAVARFLMSFVGGMVAAAALILVYVYVMGAPELPRLPVIGLPHTYVALALLVVWAAIQIYLSLLGLAVDRLLYEIGFRDRPGALMALLHGAVASALLLLLAWYYRPTEFSLQAALLVPLGVKGAVRLVAGRVPPAQR